MRVSKRNTIMRFINLVLFTLGLFIVVSNVSSAYDPFFKIGEKSAVSTVDTTWNNLNKDCKNIGELTKIISDSIYRVTSKAKKRTGSAKTYTDGFQTGLENALRDTVVTQCPNHEPILNETAREEGGSEEIAPKQRASNQSSFFHLGKNLGAVETVSAWQNLGQDCKRLKEFSKILKNTRNRANNKFANVASAKDFKKGHKQGMDSVEKRIKAECSDSPKKQQATGYRKTECSKSLHCLNGQKLGIANAKTVVANLTCPQMRVKLPGIIDKLAKKLQEDLKQGKLEVKSDNLADFVQGYVDGLRTSLMEIGKSCKPKLALDTPLDKLESTVLD